MARGDGGRMILNTEQWWGVATEVMEAELSACQVIDVIGNCSGFEILW